MFYTLVFTGRYDDAPIMTAYTEVEIFIFGEFKRIIYPTYWPH